MKYALVLGLVLVIVWLWRSSRQGRANNDHRANASKKPASLEKATEIVACQVCQVHLPRSESLPGKNGLYCSAEHRRQADNQA